MMQRKQSALTILLLSALVGAHARSKAFLPGAPQPASDFTPWTFHEDFSRGIPGWMSFPLPQDVGYDPSLYTKRVGGSPVLVRDVTSYGERVLRVGLIRPLSFHVAPSSLFWISYDLEMCGKTTDVHLAMAGVDGRRYNHSLSLLPGAHDVQVDGRRLEIPLVGVDVEAIVIEAEVASPPSGSHNRLTLRALEIHAERPARVLIRAPRLDRSPVDDIAVAQEVVAAGNPLKVGLGSGSAARVAVNDDVGGLAGAENIPAGEARYTQLAAPEKPGLYKVEITSHPARSEFCFLVLGEVPVHPRVLLTAQRLEQLRSQSYSNELQAILHRRASELRSSLAYNPNAGQNIALLSRDSVFPGLVEYFALMESYSNAISFNALDFRLSGDRQALEAARRALLAVAAWPTWTPPWFAARGLHTYYEVGVFTQRVALPPFHL